MKTVSVLTTKSVLEEMACYLLRFAFAIFLHLLILNYLYPEYTRMGIKDPFVIHLFKIQTFLSNLTIEISWAGRV